MLSKVAKAKTLNKEDLTMEENENERTQKANNWAANQWKNVVSQQNWEELGVEKVNDDFRKTTLEEQSRGLPVFFKGCQKNNGSEFPPGSYVLFAHAFDRINFARGMPAKILSVYHEARRAIDEQMRKRKQEGVGEAGPHEKDGFTSEQIDELRTQGIFGYDTLRQLYDTAYFYISMCTGSRGGESTRKIDFDNLTWEEENELWRYKQTSDLKTDTGGLQRSAGGGMRAKKPRKLKEGVIPRSSNPDRDPAKVIHLLKAKSPKPTSRVIFWRISKVPHKVHHPFFVGVLSVFGRGQKDLLRHKVHHPFFVGVLSVFGRGQKDLLPHKVHHPFYVGRTAASWRRHLWATPSST
jgi:hypothetical protein